MSRFPIPEAALAAHIAVLGKTGSGKTSTSKVIVEHLVAQGARVCILDPIKSDWWGLTSSADGKRPGLPFNILGGPRGHVPLHSRSGSAIGELVASGDLPLSIIDMADFEPGGQSRFFVDFAPMLLKRMRGVVHLVMEEAHLFAPKERGGLGDENLAIHYAKLLATAGRSKGIRLILATQRTQALHNAMLGSCETMVAHRLTAPADQKPLIDWLKANVERNIASEVAASLSGLKTGTGWVCSGEAKFFAKVEFPRIRTFDNSATPTGDLAQVQVRTAAVDVEKLRTIIGDAVEDVTANDPKVLKAEIARLKAELAKDPAKADLAVISEAEERGYQRGLVEGEQRVLVAFEAVRTELPRLVDQRLHAFTSDIIAGRANAPTAAASAKQAPPASIPESKAPPPLPAPRPVTPPAPQQTLAASRQRATGVTGPQQRILDALAWWAAFGIAQPTNEQVGFVAGYAPGSGNFNNLRGGLRAAGLIEYPAGGRVALTPDGSAKAEAPSIPPSRPAFHAAVRAKLNGPQVKLLDPILAAYPRSLTTEALAAASGYAAGSGNFNNLRGSLRTIGLIDYPANGQVRAADWLFPET